MKITAARMLGMLALIVDRAEVCLGEGDAPGDAIDGAFRDHGQAAVELEAVARGAWRTMTVGQEPDPIAGETLRKTLERLGLLEAVREEMRRAFDTQPAAVRGLRIALCHSLTRDCPGHAQGDRGVPCLRFVCARHHGNAAAVRG